MIQGSINQLLGMAAVFARMDPGTEKRAEVRRAEAVVDSLDKQAKTISADDPKTGVKFSDLAGGEIHEDYVEVLEKKAKASEALFNLEPTEERRKSFKQAKGAAQGERQHYKSEKKRIEQDNAEHNAMENMMLEQQRVQKSNQLSSMGKALTENAPKPMAGKRGTIKYDNI